MKKRNTNILIFPAGTEIGLEIYDSLNDEKNIDVFGGTSSEDFSIIVYPKERLLKIPFVDQDDCIEKLIKQCKKNRINIIYPAHDQVIKLFSENLEKFKKIDVKVILHPQDTSIVCRSKFLTYQRIGNEEFLPKFEMYKEGVKPSFKGPYFLKPHIGQGSKGVLRVDSYKKLIEIAQNISLREYIICEFLPGEEYTIDCFTDFTETLIFCEGRIRSQTTNGISVATQNIKNINFRKIALIIQNKIKMNGAWFFQLKKDINGNLKLMEVGARIAGSSTYNRFAGVNLSLMNFYNIQNTNQFIIPLNTKITVKKRIKAFANINYSFNNVYIDFDDTVVVNNKVNIKVIHFLYWCLNEKKQIILITRHKFNIQKTLKKFKIKEIFNEIVHIKNSDSKCLFIKNKKSIFIDDSFSERLSVFQKHNIPVYSTQCLPEIY